MRRPRRRRMRVLLLSASKILTLDQCIELAFENNPGLQIEQEKIIELENDYTHCFGRPVSESHGERLLYQGQSGPRRHTADHAV